jgi:hypothetical protein
MFKDAAEHDSVSRSITRAHYQTREPWMMEPVRTLTLERFGKSGDQLTCAHGDRGTTQNRSRCAFGAAEQSTFSGPTPRVP